MLLLDTSNGAYLFEGVASDRLESLVHVDGLFCTGLKVWDIAFALTPRLGSFRCHLHKTINWSINTVN